MSRTRIIPQSELIDTLWPEETISNPVSALKTLVSRIRKSLITHIGDDVRLLISKSGSYALNTAYDCIVDSEEFEYLCKQADNTLLSAGERIYLYRRAVQLYKNDFLPKLSDQLWVISLSAHYREVYIRAVKNLASLLEQEGLFSEMTDLCYSAIAIEQYDEQLHAFLLTALTRQGNINLALAHYERTTDMLYRNLGITPSKELKTTYNMLMKDRKGFERNLGKIQEALAEDSSYGAFVCEYGVFKEIYKHEARSAVRMGTCAHLGLITANAVNTDSDDASQLAMLNKKMDQLLDTIRSNLRKGDVVSRYSLLQYVILLLNSNYEDSKMVMERLLNNFYRLDRKTPYTLSYNILQVDLAE